MIVADFADLSADLRDGVLQSARLVLDRQLQIAATQIDRVDGRYNQAYQAVASSCEVCFDNPTPLWEIRARRIIHDEVEQQLYFEGRAVPRHGRAGHLAAADAPSRSDAGARHGLSGALDPRHRHHGHADPRSLLHHAGRSRRPDADAMDRAGRQPDDRVALPPGFSQGERSRATGSLTWDDLTDDDIRGHVFADGTFDIGRNIDLSFQFESVTDDGYLTTYSLPDTDLLESNIRIGRTERDTFFDVGISNLTSLREGDDNETLPTRVADGRFVHRFEPGALGGIAELRFDALGYFRPRATPGTAANGRPEATDAARISAILDWRRTEVLGHGLLLTFEAALAGDLHTARQDLDGTLNDTEARLTPYGAIELRYPLQRSDADGVRHILEPAIQVAWSETQGDPVAVEDSEIVEFDEANLFALDRFPGSDRREQGGARGLRRRLYPHRPARLVGGGHRGHRAQGGRPCAVHPRLRPRRRNLRLAPGHASRSW